MKFERLLSAAAAVVVALSSFSLAVYADDEEEEEAIKFEADSTYLTEDKEPALSFDNDSFEDYIHLTKDAGLGGISIKQDKDTYYQGNSLRVNASSDGVDGYFSCSGMVRDSDNNLVYPDAPEADDIDNINVIGIELHAEDFGLSCFDGCLINFAYRLSQNDEGTLLDDAVWVMSADEDSVRTIDSPLKLQVNTTLDDNVTQYRSNGLLSVPESSSSTKIIFEIPTQNAVNGDVLYLDNIVIQLPESAGDSTLYVANVDGYNANAEARAEIDEIKISKTTSIGDAAEEVEKESDSTSPLVFVVVGVVIVIVVAVVVFLIMRARKRFY